MKYQTISLKVFSRERRDSLCSHSNRDIFTCENNMLFSRLKISCFRAKAHLVFHWYLHNKGYSLFTFALFVLGYSLQFHCLDFKTRVGGGELVCRKSTHIRGIHLAKFC